MAWITTITAADGQPIKLCHRGEGIPSSMDRLQYTNPRTGNVERAVGIMAWAGTPGGDCPEGTVPVTIV
jgi:hypothetical protein